MNLYYIIKNYVIVQEKVYLNYLEENNQIITEIIIVLNCFNSYNTEYRLKEHEEIFNKNNGCCIIMSRRNEKMLKYNHEEKSLKAPFVIYLDLKCLLLKMVSGQNDFNNSYTERKTKHELYGWAMFTRCSFDATKNKLDYYRGLDCIKLSCKKLKDYALKNYEKKKRNDTLV